ncbi:hypothetical protein [Salmonella sp. GDC200615]|uniref:hypothetical protein n=1 Tax=Salmonella sp. GDC200615 TaxID=3423917 RepID=UPI003D32859C
MISLSPPTICNSADSAGNSYLSPRQKVMFDSITNAPSAPFGVYDPSSTNNLGPGLTGFVAYTEGMTVKTALLQIVGGDKLIIPFC